LRFIPANAGNGIGERIGLGRLAVYPRERGERGGRTVPRIRLLGLSPRTRGTGRMR